MNCFRPSSWLFFALTAVVALAIACDLPTPTEPRPSTSEAVSPAKSLHGCPPSFEAVTGSDSRYDPNVDKNGDGVICVRSIDRGPRQAPKSIAIDNNPNRRGPSTAGLRLGLVRDL